MQDEKLYTLPPPNNFVIKKSFLISLLGFVTALVFSYTITLWNKEKVITSQQMAAQFWVDAFASRFEGRIASNLAVGRGIVAQATVLGEINQQQLNTLVEALLDKNLDVRHVAIAPNLVISAVYPLSGNKKAIGLDYRKHLQQKSGVIQAIEKKKIIVVGPLTLVQGIERQLIARLPVSNLDSSLWGVVSVVIDLDKTLKGSKIERLQQRYQIDIQDRATPAAAQIFISDGFNSSKTVSQKIKLPGREWQVNLYPLSGWGYTHLQWYGYSVVSLVFSFVIAVIVFLLHRNFSLKREHIQHLRNVLTTDPLTKLSSRYQFSVYLNDLVEQCQLSGEEFSILLIDIDHFKEVNDSLGHVVGDSILVELANRLKSAIAVHDYIARLGGDEFIIVLKGVSKLTQVDAVARQLMSCIANVITLGKSEIRLTSSIGVSVFPIDAKDADSLIQHADLAVFESKRVGRNSIFYFDAARRDQADRFVQMSTQIPKALDNNEFSVYFQPIFNNETKTFTHCEALCRWQNNMGEFVSPVEFIVIAERCGLILDLGRFVLEKCIAFSKILKSNNISLAISINRSAIEFSSDEATQLLIKSVAQQDIAIEDIVLEITESLFMSDDSNRVSNYWKLKEAGFAFAIDDFGTGYSSINYLRNFPVEYLKIDRSFIVEIDSGKSEGGSLVTGIIKMAKSLGIAVVAEGVETEEQYHFLNTYGCDLIQGYLFARPMNETQFLDFMGKHKFQALQINTLNS